jgi:hypothetical protein
MDKIQSKQFDVEVIAEGSIIQITHYGDVTYPVAIASRKEASEIAQEQGVHDFLIDISQAKVTGSVLEFYMFHSLDVHLLPRPTRMALVYDLENWAGGSDDAQFSENIDINRGIVRRDFSERSDAMAWLMKWENMYQSQ